MKQVYSVLSGMFAWMGVILLIFGVPATLVSSTLFAIQASLAGQGILMAIIMFLVGGAVTALSLLFLMYVFTHVAVFLKQKED